MAISHRKKECDMDTGLDALGVLRAGLSPARDSKVTCGAQQQLADDLELRAEERAHYGDAREANVYRRRSRLVREGKPDPGWS
jgi:hypothetical protein